MRRGTVEIDGYPVSCTIVDGVSSNGAGMELRRELMRGAGPAAVMQLLKRREMYGYEIAESLGERSDGVLAMGQSTLYPLLYNLEAKRFVESRWVELKSGRKRRYYRLTDAGAGELKEYRARWQELFEAMVGLGLVSPISAQG